MRLLSPGCVPGSGWIIGVSCVRPVGGLIFLFDLFGQRMRTAQRSGRQHTTRRACSSRGGFDGSDDGRKLERAEEGQTIWAAPFGALLFPSAASRASPPLRGRGEAFRVRESPGGGGSQGRAGPPLGRRRQQRSRPARRRTGTARSCTGWRACAGHPGRVHCSGSRALMIWSAASRTCWAACWMMSASRPLHPATYGMV